MTEADLAASVVGYLRGNRYDVYQEVQPTRLGAIADIVAKLDDLVWVVECKRTLSLEVLGQAYHWRSAAHLVSVAVPAPKRHTAGREFADRIMADYGIGLLSIQAAFRGGGSCYEKLRPRLNRKALVNKFADLRPEQKLDIAGSATGGHWTPFRQTSAAVRSAIDRRPGICLKDLIDAVEHHYASDSTARACLSRYVQRGIIEGVRCERDGNALRFYLEE